MSVDVRDQFPVTKTRLTSAVTGAGMPLTYFDHGASTHAPESVLHAHERFIREAYSNVHRGAHHLSIVSTEAYEDVRWKAKAFVGARKDQEVVFAENTTDALNLAAHLMAERPGVTLVSAMEHHSNDLPHRAKGPVVHFGTDENGQVDMRDFEKKLAEHKVKLVAITAASNVTGIRPPLDDIVDLAHAFGAKVLVDGAQALAHLPTDLSRIGTSGGPDFFAAAGHKAYAPMGGAFLVAPREVLDHAEPYRPGGGTVKFVALDDAMWVDGVERHEGGTPNVPGIVAMGAAIDFLRGIGMEAVRAHELELLKAMFAGMEQIPGVRWLGTAPPEDRVGTVSFVVDGVPHALVSTVLDNEYGIATRNGCFCAHPYLVDLLGIDDPEMVRERIKAGATTREPDFPGAARASLGIYNDIADVERFLEALHTVAAKGWKGDYSWADGTWVHQRPAIAGTPAGA
ncbi:MAG: aminotransferase class V-fold PLP-dependent enzyme [Euryarchaeota archaeon]|nr:aminotransferase class V-fold PLP-dependent enzyme [Euryarchaeota archaeon]